MNRRTLTFAVLFAILPHLPACRDNTPTAATQPVPTAVTDAQIPDLLQQLEKPETRDAAADRLLTISHPQLVPLYDALDGDTASPELKTQLLTLLPRIHGRLRPVNQTSNALLDLQDEFFRIEEYRTVGTHGAAWDGLALTALKALAAGDAAADSPIPKFQAVVDAGCTDPLIRYYYLSRAYITSTLPPDQILTEFPKTLADMNASRYSPSRKFYANYRFANIAIQSRSTLIPSTSVDDAVARALVELREMFRQPQSNTVQHEAIGGLAAVMIARNPALTAAAALDQILPLLPAQYTLPAAVQELKAAVCYEFGWNARGPGLSSTVSANGWSLFAKWSNAAGNEAVKGWAIDPARPGCAALMISICTAQGSPRSEMEKWFRRATDADPEDYSAYSSKMQYLLPKWHGSREEVIAFGRECVARGNGRNRIPAILIGAQKEISSFLSEEEYRIYSLQPDVWEDYKAAYDKLLADPSRLQDDRAACLIDRANYVKRAFFCHQYADQLALMAAYREDVDFEAFSNHAQWNNSLFLAMQQEMAHPTTTQPKTEVINGIKVTR